jgi:hypothetical protein
MQIYRLNRISDKSYRKFLTLMGIPKLKPAIAAEVDLSFSTRDQQPTLVPARTQVAAKDPISGEAIIFETKDDLNVVDTRHENTVSAIQSRTLMDCKFSGSGLPDFYLDLEYTPVIEKTLKEKTLKVEVKEEDAWIEWSEVEDFDASKSGDMHYTVDLATGRVAFGDGINAKIPPKGEDNITISYSSGGGVRGNVGPYAINRVLGELAADVTVENFNAAEGGEEAETLEEALIRARKDLKTVYRAVTSADYELLAMNTPGLRVARAKAIPRYHPSQESEVPGIVTVIVIPHSQEDKSKPSVPSVGFLKTVYTHLDKHRLLTTELFVIPPEYIEVSVDATVVIKPKYRKETVEGNVRTELETFLHPIRGGVDQKGWPFGRSVYISEIYEIIDGVKGVDYVKTVTLNKNGEKQEGDIKISAHDLVCSVTHEIIVIEFLFSIDEQLISELNNKTISKGLREAFKTKKGIAISERAFIVKVGDNKWKIIDGKVVYIITKENKKLNIYKGEIHE